MINAWKFSSDIQFFLEMQDQQQQEQINFLEHRLENLTDSIYKLHDEMSNLNKQVSVTVTYVGAFILF